MLEFEIDTGDFLREGLAGLLAGKVYTQAAILGLATDQAVARLAHFVRQDVKLNALPNQSAEAFGSRDLTWMLLIRNVNAASWNSSIYSRIIEGGPLR